MIRELNAVRTRGDRNYLSTRISILDHVYLTWHLIKIDVRILRSCIVLLCLETTIIFVKPRGCVPSDGAGGLFPNRQSMHSIFANLASTCANFNTFLDIKFTTSTYIDYHRTTRLTERSKGKYVIHDLSVESRCNAYQTSPQP